MTEEIFHPQSSADARDLARLIVALDIGQELNWVPDHLALSAWLEHVPFGWWVVKALRPKTIVELGTDRGVSYASFCQATERLGLEARCYAVDAWKGDPHAGANGDAIFAEVSRVNEARWAGFSSLLRMTFAEARGFFDENDIDLLHIDGYHTYEAVSEDFQTWRNALTKCGVVLFHDTNERKGDFGVWRFWKEQKEKFPNFEFLHGHGLGVLGVGNDLPDPLMRLFEYTKDLKQAALVRNLFAVRGAAVLDRYIVRNAQARLNAAWPLSVGPVLDHLKAMELEHGRLQANEKELSGLRGLVPELQRLQALEPELQRLQDLEPELEHLRRIEQALRLDLEEAKKEVDRLAVERSTMEASASWRVTRPLRTLVGVLRGDPSYRSSVRAALGRRGGQTLERSTGPSPGQQVLLDASSSPSGGTTPDDLILRTYPDLTPLSIFPDAASPRRLTLLVDEIDSADGCGDIGATVVCASVLAHHLDLSLRIVTRHSPPDAAAVGSILAAHGIEHAANIELAHAAVLPDARSLALGPGDRILTTSWSTTAVALRCVDPSRIIYLLRDDERRLCPAGEQQLRCREILSDTRVRFVVRTAALYEHLVSGGVEGVAANGVAFEPAFPVETYYREPKPPAAKRRLVYRAQPSRPGDLFLRGLEALSRAIEQQVLDTAEWDLFFVGGDIPDVLLPTGLRPHSKANLSGMGCTAFFRGADIGLSLTDGPHPSYAALDFAASGAVVVTNRYGSGPSVAAYSDNILSTEPSVDALVGALDQAVRLVQDEQRRTLNFDQARIGRDWQAAFVPVLKWLTAG